MIPRQTRLAAGVLVAMVVLGVGAALALPDPARGKTKQALAEDRVKAAKKAYEAVFAPFRAGFAAAPAHDTVYLWSRRWLDADLDVTDKAEARRTAYKAHLERMKEIEVLYQKQVGGPELAKAAVEFYRVEAEFWVARAEAD